MIGDLPELIILIAVVVVLIILMRWVFRPSRPPRAVVPGDATPGLLVVVATGLSREQAMDVRARLGAADIRSNLAGAASGAFAVRVFAVDADRARELLSGPTPA